MINTKNIPPILIKFPHVTIEYSFMCSEQDGSFSASVFVACSASEHNAGFRQIVLNKKYEDLPKAEAFLQKEKEKIGALCTLSSKLV